MQASCQSLVGLSGVILKETMRTFVIMNSQAEAKMVLKPGTVFRVKLPKDIVFPDKAPEEGELYCDLWGDMLAIKSKKGRAKANFKERTAPLKMY